jgi:hypothetical protein
VCGQPGPELTTAARTTFPSRLSRKYGPPESCGQGLVSGRGARPEVSINVSPIASTVNSPVCSRVAGAGAPPSTTSPNPVSRSTSPRTGGAVATRTGGTPVTGSPSSARATSAASAWYAATTSTSWPSRSRRSVRPTTAVVRSATVRLTRRPAASRKQCPAVITQRGATSAPEQELSRVPPPSAGRPVMVSSTENR